MWNPESMESFRRINTDQAIKEILNTGEIDHQPIDKFKSLESYDSREIEDDKILVQEARERFENYEKRMAHDKRENLEKGKERGEAMEIVLTHLFDLWFETDQVEAKVQRTTEFDDIINGTDMVAEFKKDEEVEELAMAIDASLNIRAMEHKLEKCYEKMTGKEEDFKVKYFQSRFEDASGRYPEGPLEEIVSIVVGLGYKNADDLFESFGDYLSTKKKEPVSAEIKLQRLSTDPVSKIILKQIELQVNFYLDHQEFLREGVIDKLEKINKIIEDISENKKDVVTDFMMDEDQALEEVRRFTNRVRGN